MALLQEINDQSATTAWCPLKTAGKTLIALGTKDGASGETFDDYGGQLAVYSMKLNSKEASQPVKVIQAESTSRFNCLAWGCKGPSGMGVIAGGMQSGVITIWDPKVMKAPLATIEKHKAKVNCMAFNPHKDKQHLLATGASDNQVYIVDLTSPDKPQVYSPGGTGRGHQAEVRSVAWNSEAAHVLATAALDGACTVWSLKAQKKWAEIRDPNGAGFSAIAWSPAQGLHLLTASNNDRDPVIRLWDVRKSTSEPVAEYRGHTGSVFDISWCKADPKFVLSCGKDGRTLLWDLYAGKPVMEMSSQDGSQTVQNGLGAMNSGGPSANDVFGGESNINGLGASGTGRRYHVEFAPHDETIFSSCSFDRKVEIFSVNGGMGGKKNAQAWTASNPHGVMRAPVWNMRKCGATFGFGGHLVSFGSPEKSDTAQQPSVGPGPGQVRLTSVKDDQNVLDSSTKWENDFRTALDNDAAMGHESSTNIVQLCGEKANASDSEVEREAWKSMKVLFEPNDRDKILEHLGFNMDEVHSTVSSLDVRATKAMEEQQAQALAQASMEPQQQQYEVEGSSQMDQNQFPNGGIDHASVFGADMNGTSGSALDAFDEPIQDDADERIDDAPLEEEKEGHEQGQQEPVPKESDESNREESKEVAKVTKSLSDVCLDDVEVSDPSVDDVINKALLIGNFAVAVDCCMENNRFADAILLANCGDQDLLMETMQKYLDRFYEKKSYIPVLEAALRKDLDTFVNRSDLSGDKWKEVLAIVLQYARSDEFPVLCEALAGRLEVERNDVQAQIAACLFYICAKNVSKTVAILVKNGAETVKAGGRKAALSLSLSIVEKVNVFKLALSPEDQAAVMSMPNIMEHYIRISDALSAQGLYDNAASFLSGVDMNLYQPSPQVGYDEHGNAFEFGGLTEEQEAHNVQAQFAMEIVDRIYGSHPYPETLSNYFSFRAQPFQIAQLGISPSSVTVDPAVAYEQQEFNQQLEMPQQSTQSTYQQAPVVQQTFQQPEPQLQQTPHMSQQQTFQQPLQQQPMYQQPPAPQPTYQQPPQPAYHQQPPAPQQQQSFQQQSAPQPFQPQTFNQSSFQQQPPPQVAAPPTPQPYRPTSASTISHIKENDGFGSTAGNPTAGQKYGNLLPDQASQPYAAIGAQNGQPEVWNPQQANQPAAAPQVVKREMPPQMTGVIKALEQHLANLSPRFQTPMEKRKLADANKCLDALKENLMTGLVQEDLFAEITQLIQSLVSGDISTASKIRVSLTQRAHVWAEQKNWLKPMPTLVMISKK